MRRPLLLLSLFAAAACTSKPAATSDSTAMADTGQAAATTAQSTDDAKAAIGKARNTWLEAAKKKDSVTIAGLYTDDAELIGSEAPPAMGRAAIQHFLAQMLAVTSVESIDSRDTQVQGDLAYDYGEATQQVTPPKGKAQTMHGYYLVIARRQSDGSWKISKHFSVVPPKAP